VTTDAPHETPMAGSDPLPDRCRAPSRRLVAYSSGVTDLDALVGEWLTLPDLAEALDIEVGKARGLVRDQHVVGIKRGERTTFQVPAAFVLPDVEGRPGVIPTLRGTVIVLSDAGFTEEEILEWLFSPNDELGERPVDALINGKRAAVRRVAQTQL
jgi:hypothetical protein